MDSWINANLCKIFQLKLFPWVGGDRGGGKGMRLWVRVKATCTLWKTMLASVLFPPSDTKCVQMLFRVSSMLMYCNYPVFRHQQKGCVRSSCSWHVICTSFYSTVAHIIRLPLYRCTFMSTIPCLNVNLVVELDKQCLNMSGFSSLWFTSNTVTNQWFFL